MALHMVDHPLARHFVTVLRNRQTSHEEFRSVTRKLSIVLALEATRELSCRSVSVETPLEKASGEALERELVLVPVLRAGLAMLDPIAELFPQVSVGYVGLERHHDTAVARSYYRKLPVLKGKDALCLDPMLATGGSASQALSLMKAHGAYKPCLLCVVAAPEGVARLQADHPDCTIFCSALDRELNASKYILPGLGDYGDRLYGTM